MAPMADVTDPAFRKLVARCGAPDIFWTEFVSADGLYHTREILKMPDAENPLMRELQFSAAEHPIVAQIFSSDPKNIAYATKLAHTLGFDGVDINMGCPDRAIERQGCGSAMMKSPDAARAVIRAAKEASPLPVSVKTRVGYAAESLEEWLPVLLSEHPVAVTLHLRTRNAMSLVPANWEWMNKAVALRDAHAPDVLLLGNGDIRDVADAKEKITQSGCDGAMIGRGMFGNPWVFAARAQGDTPLGEKLDALVALAVDFEKLHPAKNFAILKKHIKAFVNGYDGAAKLREMLMDTSSAAGMYAALRENPALY